MGMRIIQTGRQTYTLKHTHKHTGTLTDLQTDTQTYRHIDTQSL